MSFSSDPALQANQLPISLEIPQVDSQVFQEIISLLMKRMINAVNTKEGALYFLQEVANFQQYFRYHTGTTTPDPQRFRNGYRMTYDLVVLNAGPIPPGATTFAASPLINGILIPVHGFGAATIAGPIYVFTGMDFNVSFNNTVPTAQTITVTNNTGSNLTQAYWTIEYLKS
jgi:hypothetical protein